MDLNELLNIHEETCEKCKTMMIRKNKDYTGGDTATDIFANFNSAKIIGMHPVKGLLIRVIDKIQRINSFTNDKKLSVPDETVYDACEDIINYAILAKAMLMKERKEKEDYRNGKNVLPD